MLIQLLLLILMHSVSYGSDDCSAYAGIRVWSDHFNDVKFSDGSDDCSAYAGIRVRSDSFNTIKFSDLVLFSSGDTIADLEKVYRREYSIPEYMGIRFVAGGKLIDSGMKYCEEAFGDLIKRDSPIITAVIQDLFRYRPNNCSAYEGILIWSTYYNAIKLSDLVPYSSSCSDTIADLEKAYRCKYSLPKVMVIRFVAGGKLLDLGMKYSEKPFSDLMTLCSNLVKVSVQNPELPDYKKFKSYAILHDKFYRYAFIELQKDKRVIDLENDFKTEMCIPNRFKVQLVMNDGKMLNSNSLYTISDLEKRLIFVTIEEKKN